MKFLIALSICAALIVFGPFNARSQSTPDKTMNAGIQLHGMVMNPASAKPVPFASIGIPGTPVGTIAAADGQFDLFIGNEYLEDSLKVSSVGFASQTTAIRQLEKIKGSIVINLTENVFPLKEVRVSNKFQQTIIVGRQSSGKLIQVSIIPKGDKAPVIGAESGLKIQVKHYPALLSNFNFYLSANNLKHIKFRLNIYSLKNNLPDTLLFNKEVYIDIKDFKTGWNQVDLSAYDIIVTADFAITLQWVDYNRDLAQQPKILVPGALSFSHTTYFRLASQDKWKSVKMNASFFATLQY
jgi:hypothetical protein